jgi:prepilin-type N-terminal cleavage/methylation domain-containing protein
LKATWTAEGFTLIELIVVMALMGMLLFWATPRLENGFISDPAKNVSRWVMLTAPKLRAAAVAEQRDYYLHVDMARQILWSSHSEMDEQALIQALERGLVLPASIRIAQVHRPRQPSDVTEQVPIRFSRHGYADQVVLYMTRYPNHRYSLFIEPFLHPVDQFEGFLTYAQRWQ